VHWTFEYEGTITGNEDGPVEGLKLAAIQEPITYLLYPAALVSHDRLPHRPLYRRDAHPRAPGNAVFASGGQGKPPSPSPWPAASPAISTTSTGTSPDSPAP
jgi:hypothetical protein